MPDVDALVPSGSGPDIGGAAQFLSVATQCVSACALGQSSTVQREKWQKSRESSETAASLSDHAMSLTASRHAARPFADAGVGAKETSVVDHYRDASALSAEAGVPSDDCATKDSVVVVVNPSLVVAV